MIAENSWVKINYHVYYKGKNFFSIVSDNEYLRLGLFSLFHQLNSESISVNAIFIDIGSLKLMSELGAWLKNAYANRVAVILICSDGDMSMVLARLPNININAKLSSWLLDIIKLLRLNLTCYLMKEFKNLICVKKLGTMKIIIIFLLHNGWNFSFIARNLNISHKKLYRSVCGLVSYFNLKNTNYLVHFLRSRLPPSYFCPLNTNQNVITAVYGRKAF